MMYRNSYNRQNFNDIERDFCIKILDRCTEKAIELMKPSLTQELYNIWENYAIECLNDVAPKINRQNVVQEFKLSTCNFIQPWEKMSAAAKFLINFQREVSTYFLTTIQRNTLNSTNNHDYLSNHSPQQTYNSFNSFNPNLASQQLRSLNFENQYKILETKSLFENILENKQLHTTQQNEEFILSILNATNNNYSKEQAFSLPATMLKVLIDASIEILASNLKSNTTNQGDRLILDTIKEVIKYLLKQRIDEIYMNKAY